MAYHQTVNAGDVFIPSASLHNDAVRLINSLPFSGAAAIGSSIVRTVSVMLHGDNNTALSSGMAVGFKLDVEYSVEATSEHTAAPAIYYVEPYDPGKHTAFGVLTTPLSKGVTGSAVISGEVVILLDDAAGSGVAALPQSGGTWRFSGSGYGILAKLSNKAVINLTGDASGTYNGYFTVKITTDVKSGTKYLVVVDGATYDNTTQSSGDMQYHVNHSYGRLPAYREVLDPATEVVFFEYDFNDGGTASIRVDLPDYPDEPGNKCYVQLARIIDGTVHQDYQAGEIELVFFSNCFSANHNPDGDDK